MRARFDGDWRRMSVRVWKRRPRSQEQASRDGYRFADDTEVKASRVALDKALLKSRDGPDERGAAILQRVRADVEPVERFTRCSPPRRWPGWIMSRWHR